MSGQTDKRLGLLLGISVVLHLGLLGITWQRAVPPLEFALQPPSLSVSLEAIEVAAAAPRSAQAAATPPAPPPKPATRPRPRPAPRPETRQISRAAPVANIPPAQSADEPAPELAEARPALNRARILTRLRRDFRQHFYYPALARRRNMEGAVTLGFGIDGEGTIHDIEIIRSSGYAILDLAARDAMQRLGQVEWIRPQLQGASIHIELPVIYRLTRG